MNTRDSTTTRSAQIRARVSHPIIDSDGHVVEFEPALLDYIREVGGAALVEQYKRSRPMSAAIIVYHDRYGGRIQQGILTIALPPLCRGCSIAASMRWDSILSSSIQARGYSLRIVRTMNCAKRSAVPSTGITPIFFASIPRG